MRYELYSKTNQRILDAAIIGCAFLAAYQIRFEGRLPAQADFQMWALWPAMIVLRLAVNNTFGIYRQVWRYVGIPEALSIFRAYVPVSLALILLRFGAPESWALFKLPLSVITMEFMMSLYGVLTARVVRRIFYHRRLSARYRAGARKRILLIGAESAGVMLGKELNYRPDVEIVGFLDDDPQKKDLLINGIRVLGSTEDLVRLVQENSIDEVIVCITQAPPSELKRLWRLCEATSARGLIVPSLGEIFDREVGVSRLRELRMEELLGRETVQLEGPSEQLQKNFSNRCILVSGAAGSIGSELVRQLVELQPARLVLVDKDENALFDRQMELQARGFSAPFDLFVADIRFPRRLQLIFETHRPEIVFHAAAHKHVPLMELNPCEAILNNVFGTALLARFAVQFGADRFVMISTDKAVNPTNVMGASKRLAELVVHSMNHDGPTRFCCVRFGNVMASRSSVIPIFQKQIAAGGPITLTHPDVRRFFMTIPEAVALVLQAGTLAENGATYVLDMGDQVRVADLARDLIELCGLQPNHDIQIEHVGLRAGEKLFEELVGDGEYLAETCFPRIRAVKSGKTIDAQRFQALLDELREASEREDAGLVRSLLLQSDIGFHQPSGDAFVAGAGG